jgi:hypothetical protein
MIVFVNDTSLDVRVELLQLRQIWTRICTNGFVIAVDYQISLFKIGWQLCSYRVGVSRNKLVERLGGPKICTQPRDVSPTEGSFMFRKPKQPKRETLATYNPFHLINRQCNTFVDVNIIKSLPKEAFGIINRA